MLRDAEDRTRQLRWQQHQLTSFMAEVKELIRPEMTLEGAALTPGEILEPAAHAGAVEAQAEGEPAADREAGPSEHHEVHDQHEVHVEHEVHEANEPQVAESDQQGDAVYADGQPEPTPV